MHLAIRYLRSIVGSQVYELCTSVKLPRYRSVQPPTCMRPFHGYIKVARLCEWELRRAHNVRRLVMMFRRRYRAWLAELSIPSTWFGVVIVRIEGDRFPCSGAVSRALYLGRWGCRWICIAVRSIPLPSGVWRHGCADDIGPRGSVACLVPVLSSVAL